LYLKRLQRNPAVSLGAHTIHAPNPEAENATPVLQALLSWARTHGHQRIAALGEEYMHASWLGTSLVLPGPTGERNSLSFAPRGAILCSADNVGAMLNQLAAVFATGNLPVVEASSSAMIPEGLPRAVRAAIRVVDQLAGNDHATRLQLALVDGAGTARLRPLLTALGEQSGALVPLLETSEYASIPLWRLLAERAVCVNTTAAGGNASLMTLQA
jgi:RHH-type proline utilization regulon transcriptional repressor/proline dehydrogenase/delta 1-pyrroline-5-carboxylate dehydrogenase